MCRVNTEERTRAMEGFCLGGILCGQRRRHFFFSFKESLFLLLCSEEEASKFYFFALACEPWKLIVKCQLMGNTNK